jgi:hypothetical protein
MNTSQIKVLTWSAAGVLGAGLALYVSWFVARLDKIQEPVAKEELIRVLQDVDEIVQKADEVVPYKQVEAAIIDLNWTGKPAPAQTAVAQTPVVPQATRESVAELVKVMLISFDAEEPAESRCVIRYTPKAQVRSAPNGGQGATPGWIKQAGDSLDAPLGHIRVAAIYPDGVEFAYAEEGRPNDRIGPNEVILKGILRVDDESKLLERGRSVKVSRLGLDGEAPAQTKLLREGIYQVGWEDAQYIGENYPDILSREVSYQTHRNPRTKQPDGIQITQVKPDSLLARHGISTGDVIKSVNGHPVTSDQEAIAFVKKNKDLYDTWEVEVESKGQLKTLVYYSPKK